MANESMIAACPKCAARYRLERSKLRAEGVRLRCTRCEAVFRVTPPVTASEPAEAARPAPVRVPEASAEPPSEAERRNLVLLADSDPQAGKQLAQTLVGWGLQPLLVHDGVEAILGIQRALPRAVILDAALPKMFGFQVCELVKRNESLRSIHVALVGAIHHRDRYRRAPSELYGADAYVERHELPEALRPVLAGFGFELGGEAAAPRAAAPAAPAREPQAPAAAPPAPAPEPKAPAPRPAPEPQAPAPQPAPPAAAPDEPPAEMPAPRAPAPGPAVQASSDPAVAAAERLARIIVSDVVLYNEEKFQEGVRRGNVAELLEAELHEGRALFDQRVDAGLRSGRDFLVEELVRVARSRGMQA